MVSGKYSALAGAISREQAIANISQNLANVSTSGYKRTLVSFESLLSGQKQTTDAKGINYSRISKTETDISNGPLKDTGNPLDVALLGDGFFKVMGPEGVLYTRRGDLVIGANGTLQTRNGLNVLDAANSEIVVSNASSGEIFINEKGEITLSSPDGTSNIAGRLGIVTINDSSFLQREKDTTFSLRQGGEESPAENSVVVSGSLESSNVNMVEEMTGMINSYRTFETYHKVIKSYSDISSKQAELGSIS